MFSAFSVLIYSWAGWLHGDLDQGPVLTTYPTCETPCILHNCTPLLTQLAVEANVQGGPSLPPTHRAITIYE